MIKSIDVENFKCFKENIVKLNKANLLLGSNSGGKSSIIQAILLSKMSIESFSKYKAGSFDLTSNKYDLNLYSFNEVLYENAGDEIFRIDLNFEDTKISIEYTPTDDENVINQSIEGNINSFNNSLIYLSSNRSISICQKKGNINNIKLGKDSEYLGYIIEKGRHKNVLTINKQRNYWKCKETSVLDIQINDWLNYILPNNRVTAKDIGIDNYISLLFGNNSNLHQTNVGYGISFVLPIIVAGLIAEKNSVLIVENPELHLHPRAQSSMANFLAIVAASGVQVIIETHSEHIVNGFRKAILDYNNPLESTDLIINYFDVNEVCEVKEVILNEKAEINKWPNGFMDQEENDLFEIRKMRLNK